jgi:propanediol utilization protein
MIIRAIGKQDLASTSTEPLEFADKDQVSANAVGYISAAVTLKLVYGFDDNTFAPKGSVTRAQMATFLSRAEPYLENRSSRVYAGYVTQNNGNVWTVQDKDGVTKQLQLYPTASVFGVGEEGRKMTASEVKLYSEVYVVMVDKVGYYVEVVNDEPRMESITGSLISTDIPNLTVKMWVDSMETTYSLEPNVSILDRNGGGISLGSLLPDSILELKKNGVIQNSKIAQINVKQVPVNKTVDGTYVSLDLQAKEIKVKESVSGQIETYPISALTTITLGDKPFDPAALYAGDTIKIEVKNGKANAVTVVKQLVELRDQGKLKNDINTDKTFVTIQKSNAALASYELSNKTQVVINGNAYATIRDLNIGDDVQLEINGNVVDRIIVTGTSIQAFSMATIVSYIPEEKLLNVKDELGKPAVYQLTAKTKIRYDETELTMDSFAGIFVKGKRVNLSVSDSNLIAIQIATRLEGNVAQINTAAGEMTITTPNNLVYTYKYATIPLIEMASKPSGATIADVKVGDSVRVIFNSSQDQIAQIQVRNSLIVNTLTKDLALSLITVRDSDITTATHDVKTIPIIREGQTGLTLADIPLDKWVQFDYIGRTLEGIRLLNPIRGTLSAVDAVNNKLTVVDYNNISHVVDVGQTFTIKAGGTTYTSLSSLKPNDRIQTVTDSKGRTKIAILTAQTKVVSFYDQSTKDITFKKETLNETNVFKLDDQVYIHQGGSLLSPNFLVNNDTVQVYFMDNKIVEISK